MSGRPLRLIVSRSLIVLAQLVLVVQFGLHPAENETCGDQRGEDVRRFEDARAGSVTKGSNAKSLAKSFMQESTHIHMERTRLFQDLSRAMLFSCGKLRNISILVQMTRKVSRVRMGVCFHSEFVASKTPSHIFSLRRVTGSSLPESIPPPMFRTPILIHDIWLQIQP